MRKLTKAGGWMLLLFGAGGLAMTGCALTPTPAAVHHPGYHPELLEAVTPPEVQQITYSDVPRELQKASLPSYRIEPPDILLIEAVQNIRPPHEPLRPGDQLLIQAANLLPLDPGPEVDPQLNPIEYQIRMEFEREFKTINRLYQVEPDGTIDFGPVYGAVPVIGLTVDQARRAIENHLRVEIGLQNPLVALSMPDVTGRQIITGEHLVRPDGTVSLGIYGGVYVTGMSLDDAKAVIERHLSGFIQDPEVAVDVLAYNSKVIYVITDGGGFGERVVRLPHTGNETVLDAIAAIEGLSEVSSKRIWVARPGLPGMDCAQVMDVHWSAITAEGITTTNYQLMPGDRIYIKADHLIKLDNLVAKVTAPAERIFGFILLGHGTVRALQFGHLGPRGFGFGVGPGIGF